LFLFTFYAAVIMFRHVTCEWPMRHDFKVPRLSIVVVVSIKPSLHATQQLKALESSHMQFNFYARDPTRK